MIWRSAYRSPLHPANAWWNEVRRQNRRMDHLLGGTRGPIGREFPLLNAWVGEEGLVVVAEVPGVTADDLAITVDGRNLTLSGSRQEAELPEGARQYRRERSSGEFSRSLELPFDVDVEAVKATFLDGVLEIELPKVAEEKPRKITINSN